MNRLMMAGALLALAGCNTAQGLGKDLQQVGGVITGTAEGVQNGAATSGRTAPPMGQKAPSNCQPDANGLVLEGCPKPQ